MPEGPEVWIVSQALNILTDNPNYSKAVGKHLFINGIRELTFGLTGKLKVECTNKNNIIVEKVNAGFCYGDDKIIFENLDLSFGLGLHFMEMDIESFQTIVSKWTHSKKKLGALLLDQKEIAGIGVAWGSEILAKAHLNPNIKACEQNLSLLANALYNIQQYCIQVYTDFLQTMIEQEENNKINLLVEFINGWYKNLYDIRNMSVYKKGEQVKTGGRTWYK